MNNSSEFTRDILHNSQFNDLTSGNNFSPFLVQKYISGIHGTYTNLVNEILNTKLQHWNDSQEIYDFLKCIIPKKSCSYKYFSSKENDKDYDVDVDLLANNLEISSRELKYMFDSFPELQHNYIDNKEKILKLRK